MTRRCYAQDCNEDLDTGPECPRCGSQNEAVVIGRLIDTALCALMAVDTAKCKLALSGIAQEKT